MSAESESQDGLEAISVVLVAERNDAHLEKSVASWDAYLEKSGRKYELLIVGNGTTIPPATFARFPHVRVVNQTDGPGLGKAIRSGLDQSRHPLFFYTFGDQRYRAADLNRLLPHVATRGMVMGYRWEYNETWLEWLFRLPGRLLGWRNPQRDPYRETWREWTLRHVAFHVFGVQFRDPSCVYLLARRAAFQHIPIQADGFFGHIEVQAKASFVNIEMEECSVSYRPPKQPARADSSGMWREGLRIFQRPSFGKPAGERCS